jgi:hypothetical protein
MKSGGEKLKKEGTLKGVQHYEKTRNRDDKLFQFVEPLWGSGVSQNIFPRFYLGLFTFNHLVVI